MSPFDFVEAISFSKKDLFEFESEAESSYVPFIVNRSLSYHLDTLMIAQEINSLHTMPKKQQFRVLSALTSKKKRFAKWAKKSEGSGDHLSIIAEYYRVNRNTAELYAPLLSKEDISEMERKMNKGTPDETVRGKAKKPR